MIFETLPNIKIQFLNICKRLYRIISEKFKVTYTLHNISQYSKVCDCKNQNQVGILTRVINVLLYVANIDVQWYYKFLPGKCKKSGK